MGSTICIFQKNGKDARNGALSIPQPLGTALGSRGRCRMGKREASDGKRLPQAASWAIAPRGDITQKPHRGRRIGPTSTSNRGEAKAIPIPASVVPNHSASPQAAERHLPLPLLLGSRDPHRSRSPKHIAARCSLPATSPRLWPALSCARPPSEGVSQIITEKKRKEKKTPACYKQAASLQDAQLPRPPLPPRSLP